MSPTWRPRHGTSVRWVPDDDVGVLYLVGSARTHLLDRTVGEVLSHLPPAGGSPSWFMAAFARRGVVLSSEAALVADILEPLTEVGILEHLG